jgi:transcriptional regulator with XRE-family HTH domain
MDTSKKKVPSPRQQAECEALRIAIAAYNEHRPKPERITQAKAAERMGITPSAFSAYLSGRLPLNTAFAMKILKIFAIPIAHYSQRLDNDVREINAFTHDASVAHIPSSLHHGWEQLNALLTRLPNLTIAQIPGALKEIELAQANLDGLFKAIPNG